MSYNSSGDLPKLYDIFLCEVGRLEAYGVFVKIPGFKKNGLVHKSQMSNTRIEHPEDMVANGDRVYCKVISVDDEGRIGMSMKVVNQTSGTDLDPTHVQASLDEQRRKTGHVRETRRINLGAVLDTTCSKCGGKGHFAQDCFHIPGATTYELLPDLDYLRQQQEAEEQKETEHDHHKKKKKKKDKKNAKKEKKDKHHKRKHKDSAHESHSHSSGVEKQRRLSDHDEDTHRRDSRRSSDSGKHKETDKQGDRKRHASDHDRHGYHGDSEKHHRHGDDRKHSRTESGSSRNDR